METQQNILFCKKSTIELDNVFSAFKYFSIGKCFLSVRSIDRVCVFLRVSFFLFSLKAVSSKTEEWYLLGFGRGKGGENFLHVQSKPKMLSLENTIMELQEGFNLLTSYSISSCDEYITSPMMQLQS